jgi:glycerate dehydrogenase
VQEPPPPESALWGAAAAGGGSASSSLTMTPHIGWKRLETRQRLVDAVADNVKCFLAGSPINVVTTGDS